MSREPIRLYPAPEPPPANGHASEPPGTAAHSRAAGVCALVAVGCFSAAIVMGWGLIGLLILVGVFGLFGAVLLALPRRPRR